MTLWRLEVVGREVSTFGVGTIARALGLQYGAATEASERLALGWPAFVASDRCDERALVEAGIRAVRISSLPASRVGTAAGAERLARAWGPLCEALAVLAPEALSALRQPALAIDCEAVERSLGGPLPEDYAAWLALHDGCSDAAGPLGNWRLSSLVLAASSKALRDALPDLGNEVRADPEVASVWWHPRWFPFAENGAGDALCLDLAPTPEGSGGQVIEFRHDDDRRSLVARSFTAWVEQAAVDVREGRLVATEDSNGFFGIMRRADLTGSLASLRVRGEGEEEHARRVEREILGDPLQLAMQVVPRLRNAKRLELVSEAGPMTPPLVGMFRSVATELASVREPSGRPAAILRALRASRAVASVSATLDDVAKVIAESAR